MYIVKRLLEIGWKLRESGFRAPAGCQFLLAPLFLITSIVLFWLGKDRYQYTEGVSHLVYWFKLLSRKALLIGDRLSEHSVKEVMEYSPKKRAAALRARISILMDQGRYAEAMPLITDYLEVQVRPGDRGDMLAHKALALLRMGMTQMAKTEVAKALGLLDDVPSHQQDYAWGVWKSNALMVHAEISHAFGQTLDAKNSATHAYDVATAFKAKERIRQARILVERFQFQRA